VAKLHLVLTTSHLLGVVCRIQWKENLNYSVLVFVGFVLWTASH